jgi:uroporphyrinogen-III synthase
MAKTAHPLTGLSIAATRPREQAKQLAQKIRQLGGECVSFPLLEITPLQNDLPLRELIARLHEFHLAIFISPNAVRYGMEMIKQTQGLPDTLQIATIGHSSAVALQEQGIPTVISPRQRFDSEALLALPELQEMQGKNVVIFRGDSGRELLGDTLNIRGARVEYANCYHRGKSQSSITELLAARPDAITVTSSEALHNLSELLNPADRKHLLQIPLFVTHDRIAAAAQKLGWHNIICSNGGDDGIVSALTQWAMQKKGKQS